jgi:acyl carrier protein
MSNDYDSNSAREAVENYLKGLWSRALRLESIGLDDDFFEHGGDSLAAMQIAAQVADRFRLDISTVMAFNQPTIRELATAIERALTERADELSDDELDGVVSGQGMAVPR